MPSANLAETSRERWFLWLSVAFMALYYPVLIRLFELDLFADGSQSLFRPVLNGMTFNSMMYHLLAGRFEPGTVRTHHEPVDDDAVDGAQGVPARRTAGQAGQAGDDGGIVQRLQHAAGCAERRG